MLNLNLRIMKKNMGNADKFLRVALAALIGALYYSGIISGIFGVIMLILATIFLVTSFMGYCPLYDAFGLSTRHRHPTKPEV